MRVVDDPEDFLASPKRYIPNSSLFKDTLASMHPEDATIFIGTRRLNISPNVTSQTGIDSTGQLPLEQAGLLPINQIPWPTQLNKWEGVYKIPYDVVTVNDTLASFWKTDSSEFDSFNIPMSEYAARNLKVLEKPFNSSTVPLEIQRESGSSLWWLQDTTDFPEPRVNLRCDINTTNAQLCPDWEGMIT